MHQDATVISTLYTFHLHLSFDIDHWSRSLSYHRDYKIHSVGLGFDNKSQNLDHGLANILDAFPVQVLNRNSNGISGATVEVWYAAGREGKLNHHNQVFYLIILFAS